MLYFVFLVSRDCCVALPHDATGLSAVCDCPDHTHLLFFFRKNNLGIMQCIENDVVVNFNDVIIIVHCALNIESAQPVPF